MGSYGAELWLMLRFLALEIMFSSLIHVYCNSPPHPLRELSAVAEMRVFLQMMNVKSCRNELDMHFRTVEACQSSPHHQHK